MASRDLSKQQMSSIKAVQCDLASIFLQNGIINNVAGDFNESTKSLRKNDGRKISQGLRDSLNGPHGYGC
jgi:hypothetical protein